MFPDFGVSRTLAPFAETSVEFTPDKAGRFGFACGMSMFHGTLVVEERKVPRTEIKGRSRNGKAAGKTSAKGDPGKQVE